MPLILALSLTINILLLFLFFRYRKSGTQSSFLRQQNKLIKRLQNENDYFATQHRHMQMMINELAAFVEQTGRDCQNGKSGIINLPAENPLRKRSGQQLLRIGRHLKDHFHLMAPPAGWYQKEAWKEWKNGDLPAQALKISVIQKVASRPRKQEV
jgi:hypothetical protein